MKTKKTISLFLTIILVFSAAVFAFAADESTKARVVFQAGEPDANGVFNAIISVYDATFNAFQFAFSYDTDVVMLTDKEGKAVSSFTAAAGEETALWMEPIGNNLDSEKGLLECGGYVKPGRKSITVDSSGILLYTFTFKKISPGNAGIKLATESSGGPFNPSIKEGGGLAEAGYNVDAKVEVQLPESLGESVVAETVAPENEPKKPNLDTSRADQEDAKVKRLQNTLILQIDNRAALQDGNLIKVDENNTLVMPYIDENSRTMVPVRLIAESMGAVVDWDADKLQVIINFENNNITMTIGSKSYTINNSEKTMDTVPVINEVWDRTMVPVRFIAEALGKDVKWDPVNKLVIVSPLSKPWNMDGTTEKEVMNNVLLILSPLMRDFM